MTESSGNTTTADSGDVIIDWDGVGLSDPEQMRSFLSALVSYLPVGVLIVSKERVIAGCNRRLLDILGKSDLLGTVVGGDMNSLLGDRPTFMEALKKAFDEGVDRYEIPYVSTGGMVVKVRGVKIAGGTIFLVSDITAFTKTKAELEKQREENVLKDEFMDIAAHDLRGPAGAVRGFIARILDGDTGKINDRTKELLENAYEGSRRLINLVNDFLTVSRLQRGVIKMVPKMGNLDKWVGIVVREAQGLVGEKGIYLDYKKAKIPQVFADEDRIIEVLTNLVGNAIKFTDEGGIGISHQMSDGKIITHVVDTGAGIPAEQQRFLFKKFSGGSAAKKQSGLGLGLYISKEIVEASGGKIWLNSIEGKGSVFSFSLPVAK